MNPPALHHRFDPEPSAHWTRYVVGDAAIEQAAPGARLVLAGASAARYSDSQLDDFHGRQRRDFLWKPPLSLTVRARFSHSQGELQGTAGFGWWNAPFSGDRAALGTIGPQVLWFFFASAPSNLAATPGWSGQGWFAQSMDVPTLPGWFVRLGMLALRLPGVNRAAQRAAGTTARAAEQPLPDVDITEWHRYRTEWRATRADFYVDDAHVLRSNTPPRGPLALVLWMDNQWATVQGAGGLLDVPGRQWLELDEVEVRRLDEG